MNNICWPRNSSLLEQREEQHDPPPHRCAGVLRVPTNCDSPICLQTAMLTSLAKISTKAPSPRGAAGLMQHRRLCWRARRSSKQCRALREERFGRLDMWWCHSSDLTWFWLRGCSECLDWTHDLYAVVFYVYVFFPFFGWISVHPRHWLANGCVEFKQVEQWPNKKNKKVPNDIVMSNESIDR